MVKAVRRGRPTTRKARSGPVPRARPPARPVSPPPSSRTAHGAELPGIHRTFGCRHRQKGVGDFSAQCLNGRRQAMIFRLCGVALFQAGAISSMRASRAETVRTARPSDCRWRAWAAPGQMSGAAGQAVSNAPPGADIHTASSLRSPQPRKSFFKINVGQNRHASKTARSFSNCASILEKPAPGFNRSRRPSAAGKVDRLG
ncbi:hypothetical protein FBZ96_102993 [Bradyrhizobium stylosanthis]|uniref:Uncharacterized protein n=1 Tax=Bradyrhizobium stylosanthis TaxID=1803665 RepID=A0A560E597_9BRAD|nr:hypothetical protein FBZ96_102993 [Bradyrhizobium stylosanthis]